MINAVILSCEHGGNHIPYRYRHLFSQHKEVLETHRGWDLGALELAHDIGKALKFPLYFSLTSRLLIELNRSLKMQDIFSEFTKNLQKQVKDNIIELYYLPYRNSVEAAIAAEVEAGKKVLHLSIHSFTPVLNDEVRTADIGLLYDTHRKSEEVFCNTWTEAIEQQDNTLIVKHNYPYSGTADGFTTYLRTRFPNEQYAGIELEVNQKFFENENPQGWLHVKDVLINSLYNLELPKEN